MRKLIADEWVTLDGVLQAPGFDGEDTDDGFPYGGWHMPYFDDMSRAWVAEAYAEPGGFVLGRRTYEILGAYWPTAPPEEQVIAGPLNALPKYVASRTLSDPLEWEHATVLGDDVPAEVAALKEQDGGDLRVIGSGNLLQTLLEHGLVDELRLMIDPIVLGRGKRLFDERVGRRPLALVESEVGTTGAILATYSLHP